MNAIDIDGGNNAGLMYEFALFCKRKLKDYEKASLYFRKVIDIEPKNTSA